MPPSRAVPPRTMAVITIRLSGSASVGDPAVICELKMTAAPQTAETRQDEGDYHIAPETDPGEARR